MTDFLKHVFALSDQGAKDLHKAIWSCTVTNLCLMLPVSVIYLVLRETCGPYITGEDSGNSGIWLYVGMSVLILILLFVLEYIQYNATYLASYSESANQRISLAEILRKLPLAFFGKKDLSDLTTTIMADCATVETSFSHFIPELIGAGFSLIPVAVGLAVMNLKMTAALFWVIPAAFLLVVVSKKQQDRMGRKTKAKKLIYVDGIQECIENIKDIKASNQSEKYLRELDEKLAVFEKTTIRGEFALGVFVTSAKMVLKLGIATTLLMGGILLVNGELDFMVFLVFIIAASRVYDPLQTSLENLAAIFNTLLSVERMREIREQRVQTGAEQAEYRGCDIRFDHVGFAYNDGEAVLSDVSFTAE